MHATRTRARALPLLLPEQLTIYRVTAGTVKPYNTSHDKQGGGGHIGVTAAPLAWQAFNVEGRLSAASAWKGDDRERFRGRWTGRNADCVILELYQLEGQLKGGRIRLTAILPDWMLRQLGIKPRTFAAK